MKITESQIRQIVRESVSRMMSLPRELYHVSNPIYRKDIMTQGLKPMIGDSYRAHHEGQKDLKPVIFLKDGNDYDSTYDDDRWLIDATALDPSCLFGDFDKYMAEQGCYVYTKPISPESIKLVHEGTGASLNESVSPGLSYEINGQTILFNCNGRTVGELCYRVSDFDSIASEYSESVEDFDDSIMSVFDYSTPIVNIEDVWIYKEFRGMGLFRQIFEMGMKVLGKYRQFILRTCSDSGFPENKLVEIYKNFGFIPKQRTGDGTIMVLR